MVEEREEDEAQLLDEYCKIIAEASREELLVLQVVRARLSPVIIQPLTKVVPILNPQQHG